MKRHLPSELIEPLLIKTIGELYGQYHPNKRKTKKIAMRFWLGMKTLSLLTACNAAPHAFVVMNNHLQTAAKLIEKDIGRHPILEHW